MRLCIESLWHIFEKIFNIMMVVQDTLERLTTDLMRDREERRRERRVREERN